MQRILRLNQSKWSMRILLACFFLLVFVLTALTPYIADDFTYMFGFHNKEWIRSFGDIMQSMYVHSFAMNGRFISHGLEQMFFLVPKLVFCIFNALVFTGVMYVLYRICNFSRRRSAVLLLSVFMAFWYFTPAFGQVVLWQVGSLNYLWGLAVGIVFLLPYLAHYVNSPRAIHSPVLKVLFSLYAVVVGLYTEITSFVVLFLAVALVLVSTIKQRKRLKTWLWIPIVTGGIGYFCLLHVPAEMAAKATDRSFEVLLSNFNTATTMLQTFLLPLGLIWLCILALSFFCRVDSRRQVLSVLFAVGAIIANYMLVMASYYPERCICTSAMLLILACGVLCPVLRKPNIRPMRACGFAVLFGVFCVAFLTGTVDIIQTHSAYEARGEYIESEKTNGETNLTVPLIYASTKYSAYYDTKDLDTVTTDTWPNVSMASFYGLDSILGVD